jgi:hypothetical protein
LLFTETSQVSLTTSEGKIEIIDTVISFKSIIRKDENGWILLIIILKYQLAYPDCKSVKGISDSLFADKYMIRRKHVGLRKITRNVKIKIEAVYPTVHDKYLMPGLNNNGNYIGEFAHRLTDSVFKDKDNNLNKTECDHIERFP